MKSNLETSSDFDDFGGLKFEFPSFSSGFRHLVQREENKERKNMKKDEESSNDVYDRKLLKNVEEVRLAMPS